MTETFEAEERRLLEQLDAALHGPAAVSAITSIVERVERQMVEDPAAIEAWEPVSLDVYGDGLPPAIRSSWVFALRARVTTGAERHPNSHQRMTSWLGHGDFQVHDGERWRSHEMVSDGAAALEERWISIPPDTWHQGVVAERDWVVVSFHTALASELIEERPDPSNQELTRQRRYLDVSRQ